MFGLLRILPLLGYLLLALMTNTQANNFLYPGHPGDSNDYSLDPIFPLGSTQHLQWNTDFSSYNITLWQQSKTGGSAIAGAIIYAKSAADSEVGGFDWLVQTYSLVLDNSNVFFIWAVSTQENSFTSHYFNITATAAATSLSSSTTSSIRPSSTSSQISSTMYSSTITSTTSLPTSTQATATRTPQPQNSDTATKVGLGVGLGLGIPTVLLLGVYVGMKVVKTRRTPSPDQPIYIGPDPPKYQNVNHFQDTPMYQPPEPRQHEPEPIELPTRWALRELP